jgi:hypothetical protein
VVLKTNVICFFDLLHPAKNVFRCW